MEYLKYLFSLLVLWFAFNKNITKCDEGTPKVCPSFCKCDLYEERNRADCRSRRLISPNIEIPNVVEILDFSYNDITYVDNNCFQALTYLYQLNLAHNAIQTIELDAFSTLDYLNALDLSYNRLEYLDARLVEANTELQTLNLEGNKFMSLPAAPLLRSTSLLYLNLRNAQINFINLELLDALPQLRQLDVAQNLLINFQAAAFNAPRQLQQINFEENPLICDHALRQAMATLERRSVIVMVDDCSSTTAKEQQQQQNEYFERIAMLGSAEADNDASAIAAETSLIERIWRNPLQQPQHTNSYSNNNNNNNNYNVNDDNNSQAQSHGKFVLTAKTTCNATPNEMCRRYQQCLGHISQLLATKIELNTDTAKIEQTFSINDLKLAVIMGAAAGVSLMIIMGTCVVWCQTVCGKNKQKTRRQRGLMQTETLLAENNTITPTAPPANVAPTAPTLPARTRQPRRGVRRAPAPLPPYANNVIAVRDSGDNFLSRLFGRPARHQYYRSLNQNAATLIRSLSRTNLFNNRERERYPSSATTAQDTNDRSATSQQRPETPPPNYGDVVSVVVDDSGNRK